MEPQIIFTLADAAKWNWKNLKAQHEQMVAMWSQLRAVTGYPWDNTQFRVCTSDYDKPVISILFLENGIGCWTPDGLTGLRTVKTYEELREVVHMVQDGNLYCDECKTWKRTEDMKRYSFAGVVCPNCYNPQHHRPADTRGD